MAYAASAAMNFRQPPPAAYPQQTNPYPSGQPQQQVYHQPSVPAASSTQYSQPPTVCVRLLSTL